MALIVLALGLFAFSSANAVDYVWINRTSKTGVMMKTYDVSMGRVTLTGLVANVTTSSILVSTGNVNIPVTVNGVLLYIKARTAR
ncbi:hypothetical protein [Polynucleobacter sp.]|uniref:hypothetical protein n=1 Tax=Polynucleobacter sp. TaxID=2029855 RepID=UPI003F69B770